MLMFLLQCIFFVLLFVLFLVAAGSGNRLYRPNGYSPRGGWGPRSNKIVVGEPIRYKHGQQVYVGSLNEFLENKCTLKYYNKFTDEFQDTDPLIK